MVAALAAMPARNQPRSARQNSLAMAPDLPHSAASSEGLRVGVRIQRADIHHAMHPTREPAVVRGDDERAALGNPQEPVDHDLGRLWVQMLGRLVREDDIGIGERRPHQRQALRLAAGDALAVLAEHRRQPARQLVDHALARRAARPGPRARDAPGAPRPSVRLASTLALTKLGRCPSQAMRRLQPSAVASSSGTPSTRTSPAVGRTRPAIRPSSIDLPLPLGPDEGNVLAGADGERDVAQRGLRHPAEAQRDVAETDAHRAWRRTCPLSHLKRNGRGRGSSVAQQGRPVRLEDAADLAAGGQRRGPVVIGDGEVPQRLEELRREQQHVQAARQRQRHPVGAEAEIPSRLKPT